MSDQYRRPQGDHPPGQVPVPVPSAGPYGAYPPYPAVPPQQPRSRKWLVWVVLAGLLLVGGCSALVVKGMQAIAKAQANAERIAEETLGQWRDGNHGAIWDEAAPELQQSVARDQFASFLASMEEQVGKPRSWSMTGFETNANVANGGLVRTTTFTYQVIHEQGETTTTIQVDGQDRLLAIDIGQG